MKSRLPVKRNPKSGQTMTETVIVTGLIALAGIVAVSFFGGAIKNGFISMKNSLMGVTDVVISDPGSEPDTAPADFQ